MIGRSEELVAVVQAWDAYEGKIVDQVHVHPLGPHKFQLDVLWHWDPTRLDTIDAAARANSGAPSLVQMCDDAGYGTDKQSTHGYMTAYDELFGPLRTKPIKLLEVGVYQGNSLRLWRDYFINAQVIAGLDLTLQWVERDNDIEYYEGDSRRWTPPTSYDVIIDDGSHEPADQIATFRNLREFLAPGGIYIIEDIPFPDGLAAQLPSEGKLWDNRDGATASPGRGDSVLWIFKAPLVLTP